MSHLCTIKTEIKDLQALQDACKELGWTFTNGGKVRYYMGDGQECDYTIEMVGSGKEKRYNIGVVKNGNEYEILCDNAMSGGAVLPSDQQDNVTKKWIGKLKQAYAVAKVNRQAKKQRLTVKQQIATDGSVIVTLQGRF